jgi:hypothetical protein
MKHLFFLLPVFTTLCLNAQSIKEGDNLQTAFKKIAKPCYFTAPAFTGWIEGADMFLIGTCLMKKCANA